MPLKGALMDTLVPENFGRPANIPAPQKPAPFVQQPSKPAVPAPAPHKPAEPSKPAPQKPSPAAPPPVVPEKKPEQPKPSVPPLGAVPEKKLEPKKQEEPQKQPEPSQPAPTEGESTAQFKGGVATGLVIDGRGLGLRPALLPKIVDTQGREIYVGQVATRTNAVEQGVAGYAKDVNAAANNFRVTDNPAVIKGLRASGTARTDIVVGQADAQVLRQLGSRGDFLQYCRVIIVY
jgi:outer membrane biosynthesis protein TonB